MKKSVHLTLALGGNLAPKDTDEPTKGNLVSSQTIGAIFAATGLSHGVLARTAAQSLREHHPDLAIDLFTDVPYEDDNILFSRVILIKDVWFRSKIDAMIETRFDRTIFFDADVVVVAAIDDLFELLDRFDIALAQDQEPNSKHGSRVWRIELPPCFPQLNSGVIAYRSTPDVLDLFRTWRHAVRSESLGRDQPALRELLWQSDLRMAVLPPQYNFTQPQDLVLFRAHQLAPRVIHGVRGFRDGPAPNSKLRRQIVNIIKAMTENDSYLAERAPRDVTRISHLQKKMLQLRAFLALAVR